MKTRSVRRALALAGAAVLAAVVAAQARAAVPVPAVAGPVAATVAPGDPSHDYPFFASHHDLAAHGYVEEEFFLSGTASTYAISGLNTGTVLTSGNPYRTRIVVRRPVKPAKFNGTAIVEWYNVSNSYDQEVDWLQTYAHLMREGYAWVGVSAQRAGIHAAVTGLRAWSPARYGTLDVTNGGAILNDALSYDIFSQAGQAVRDGAGGVLGDRLRVRHVLATGHSQSAGRLRTYYNSIHPLAGVYEGFLIRGVPGASTLRTDLTTPIWKLNTESDVLLLGQAVRQPDTDYIRTWEVAGSTHGDLQLIAEHGPLRIRDVGAPPQDYPPDAPTYTCAARPFSRIPQHHVQGAAYDHLVRWAVTGIQPPHATPIQLVTTSPAVAARDTYGNALGGIRLSQHDVPTAVNSGLNSGPGFCFLHGAYTPFDAGTLALLYPSHNHYLREVVDAARANLADGYITLDDFRLTKNAAREAEIGRPKNK
jgi:hypothetical protein